MQLYIFFTRTKETLKKKSFQIETWAEPQRLSNTVYGSDDNEVFENNSPELDAQMLAIDKLDIHPSYKSSSKTNYGD